MIIIDYMIQTMSFEYRDPDDLIQIQSETAKYKKENVFVQVFSGIIDRKIIIELIKTLKTRLPGVSILGTTTAGEIIDNVQKEDTIIINVSFFEETKIQTQLYKTSSNLKKSDLIDDCSVAILFTCGIINNDYSDPNPYFDFIHSHYHNALIAGGLAGDNREMKKTFVFTEDGISETGAAAAFLSGDSLRIFNGYNFSWRPMGPKLLITEKQGDRIISIDNKNIDQLYKHYLGLSLNMMNTENRNILDGFPFILKKEGVNYAVIPNEVDTDFSFAFHIPTNEGDKIQFGFYNYNQMQMDVRKICDELAAFAPQTSFFYSCSQRKILVADDIDRELSSFKLFGPSAGFFSYGEFYSPEVSNTKLIASSLTILSLAEGEPEDPGQPERLYVKNQHIETPPLKPMTVLQHLVSAISEDLEESNRKLVKLANLDSLTGLANRRRYDEILAGEVHRINRSDKEFALIFIDVDYFKYYNDTYGHVEGDICLKRIGEVLANAVRRFSDGAFRYGGEEFACILPFTGREGAELVAEDIKKRISELKIPHEKSHVAEIVTISSGVLIVDKKSRISPSGLTDICDNLLYKAKKSGRNRIVYDSLTNLY